jgi:pilus assembly protein CpaF
MWQIRKADSLGSPSKDGEAAPVANDRRSGDADYIDLKVELHRRLIDLINLSALEKMTRPQIETEIGELVHEQLAQQKHALNHEERKQLVADILDELLGLGPLEPLLKDNSITDILVNGSDVVFAERKGVLERVETRFKDERHLLRIIQKIVSAVG